MSAFLIAGIAAVALLMTSASSASAAQYWLHNTQTVPTTHCYTGYGPGSWRDLLQVPPGGPAATYTGQTIFGCSPPFPAGAQLVAGSGSYEAWFTNTGKKSCTTIWYLLHNATPTHVGELIASGTITIPARTNTPTEFSGSFAVPDTTLPPNDQLMWMINVRTRTGGCSTVTLYYNSPATDTNINLPTLVG